MSRSGDNTGGTAVLPITRPRIDVDSVGGVLVAAQEASEIARTRSGTDTAPEIFESADLIDDVTRAKLSARARWWLVVAVTLTVGVIGTAVWRADQAMLRAREGLAVSQETAARAVEKLTAMTTAAADSTTEVFRTAADAGLFVVPESGTLPVAELDAVLGTDAASRVDALQTTATDLLSGPVAATIDLVPARAELETRTGELLALAAVADIVSADLSAAADALAAELAAHLLAMATDGYLSAMSHLDDTIAAGSMVLSESEGQVLDDGPRVALSDAITAAQGVLDAAVDQQDVAALTQAATDLTAQADTIGGAVGAVTDARAAWQAEQDRLAQEAAAAAARAREAASSSGSSGGTRGTTGSTGKSGTSGSGVTGSGGGNAPLPRLGSNPGSHTGDGTVNCTTPNCGIVF